MKGITLHLDTEFYDAIILALEKQDHIFSALPEGIAKSTLDAIKVNKSMVDEWTVVRAGPWSQCLLSPERI